MAKFNLRVLSFLIIILLSSCKEKPIPTTSDFMIIPGDVVVANISNSTVVLLSSDGTFKKTLYNVKKNGEFAYGVGWKHDTKEVLVSVDGSDRVMAISVVDGKVRTLIQSSNLAGNIRGVTQLVDGSILVAETNSVEKFTTDGIRVTDGFPITGGMNGIENIYAKSDGGFVLCARTTDVLRTFSADGTMEGTRASGIGGTTDGYGCTELNDGTIVASWSGTADTISFYDSGLIDLGYSYNDTVMIASPRGVGQLANGNIIVADSLYNQLVEIDSQSGDLIGIFANSGLSGPNQLIVIPDYL